MPPACFHDLHTADGSIMRLSDEQWALVGPLIPPPPRRADNRGGPWQDNRTVLQGILRALLTDAAWDDSPACHLWEACRRRFMVWA